MLVASQSRVKCPVEFPHDAVRLPANCAAFPLLPLEPAAAPRRGIGTIADIHDGRATGRATLAWYSRLRRVASAPAPGMPLQERAPSGADVALPHRPGVRAGACIAVVPDTAQDILPALADA